MTDKRRLPEKNGQGIYVHKAECECWLCADPVKFRYATPKTKKSGDQRGKGEAA